MGLSLGNIIKPVTSLVSNVAGTVTGQKGADEAARIAQGSAQEQIGVAKQYNEPFVTAGSDAMRRLQQMLGLPTTDASGKPMKALDASGIQNMVAATPGYQFAMKEAMNQVKAGASAQGRHLDPSMLMEMQTRAAGLASSTFDNYMQRLMQQSEQGRVAAGQITGTAVGAMEGAARTQGAAAMQTGNFIGNIMNTGMGLLGGAALGGM